MQKEPTKNLKYYWDNRYSYIVNFVKGNDYLWIKRIILTALALTISCIYKEGLPSNNLVLFLSFVTTAIVSILYFVFYDKKEFLKRLIIFVGLFVSLFIILFIFCVLPFIDRGEPRTELLIFIDKTSIYWGSFVSLYMMFFICFLSLFIILFSFVSQKAFGSQKLVCKYKNFILSSIVILLSYIPTFVYIFTGIKL